MDRAVLDRARDGPPRAGPAAGEVAATDPGSAAAGLTRECSRSTAVAATRPDRAGPPRAASPSRASQVRAGATVEGPGGGFGGRFQPSKKRPELRGSIPGAAGGACES
jgi:hypothetical protein